MNLGPVDADLFKDAASPHHRHQPAAAVIGALAHARPVVMIYSFQSPEAIAADVERTDAAAVLADPQDWTGPVTAAAQRIGAARIVLGDDAPAVAAPAQDRPRPAVEGALAILTSGTTGPPKRFVVGAEVLEHTVFSVTGGLARPDEPPELVYWPLGGIGGVCQLVTGVYVGKRMVLLERFAVDAWVRAVKTHGLQRVGVQPAVVRMLLDADLDPAAVDLAFDLVVGALLHRLATVGDVSQAELEAIIAAAGSAHGGMLASLYTRPMISGRSGSPLIKSTTTSSPTRGICTPP